MNPWHWASCLANDAAEAVKHLVPARLALAQPRITRDERRRLRWRRAIQEFIDLTDMDYPAQARRRAHRALRMWPTHPQSHAVIAIAYQEGHHHEEALRHFDHAYALSQTGDHASDLRGLKSFLAGDLAALAIHSCCALRAEALTDAARRDWTEHAVEWFDVALRSDAFHVDVILNDPILPRDLRGVLKAKRESVADLSWAVQP